MDDDVQYARNESRFSGTDKRKVRARLTDCGRKSVFLSMVGGEGGNWPYSLYGVRFATCRIRYSHSKKSLPASKDFLIMEKEMAGESASRESEH